MDFTSFKPISGNIYSRKPTKKATRTQIYTHQGPPATDSGSPTPPVSETERELTCDEQISPAVRSPATA